MHRRFSLLTLPLLSTPLVFARSYNVTIDDQLGDPTTGQSISYSPPSSWNSGQTCSGCTATPSPVSDAYMGTWKDASFVPSGSSEANAGQIIQASVPFIGKSSLAFSNTEESSPLTLFGQVGTAVYVNCILTGSSEHPDGNTDMTFKVDNIIVGTYQQSPNNDATYHFNVSVFSITGLDNSVHTITLESGYAGKNALVLLDSIVYTKEVDDPTSPSDSTGTVDLGSSTPTSTSSPSSSSSSPNTPVIIGSVVGGIVAVIIILVIAFLCYRRQRRREGGVRVVLDSSDVPSPMSPYSRYPAHPNRFSQLDPEMRNAPFILRVPGASTLAPGDSVSQVSASSDHTSDWTSVIGSGNARPTFAERARAFAVTRGRQRSNLGLMKVQNATDADMHELDVCEEINPPAYMPFKFGSFAEKEKS